MMAEIPGFAQFLCVQEIDMTYRTLVKALSEITTLIETDLSFLIDFLPGLFIQLRRI